GIGSVLFRNSEAAIHLLEAACIVAVGWVAAEIVPREERPDGVAGLAALALAAWNAILFGFWDTGQVELWEAACLVVGLVWLVRTPKTAKNTLFAGVWAGSALLFKLTAGLALAPLLGMAVGLWWNEPSRERVRGIGAFVLG